MIDFLITDTELCLHLENRELFINLKKLRLACPCAHCCGEKDVFGNIYKPKASVLASSSFKVRAVSPVGNYALRVFWKDNHSKGIYTFGFLKTFNGR